jgi:hypothetical protein
MEDVSSKVENIMAILGEMGESGVESDMTGLKDAISDSAMSKL